MIQQRVPDEVANAARFEGRGRLEIFKFEEDMTWADC